MITAFLLSPINNRDFIAAFIIFVVTESLFLAFRVLRFFKSITYNSIVQHLKKIHNRGFIVATFFKITISVWKYNKMLRIL